MEAERLQIGNIELAALAERAPKLLSQLRDRTDFDGIFKDPKVQYVRLTQNLLTCLALAFTLGLITELLQRRRNRKPFQTSSENPLPS